MWPLRFSRRKPDEARIASNFFGPLRFRGRGPNEILRVLRVTNLGTDPAVLDVMPLGSRRGRRYYVLPACTLRTKSRENKIKVAKPHDRLVPVSSTRCRASTSGLSTTWSTWGLQETEVSGKPNLEVGFPLRCFQRLSLPNVATRRCGWRHNRNTSGPSIPVLSY